ncbi:HIRAN domain-containing protein [Niveibacterium sp.]|uniref:HIRAN domain-containing protein n=1 Tax=Niveibacterium sp. TaxID=2017444 RepID=UPI0035B0BA35
MDSRGLRRLLIAATLLAALAPAFAAPRLRVLVQRAQLAGFTHYEAPSVWAQLRAGAPLALQREADNPHDARAITVHWDGHKLGYLPRAENDAVSAAMDAGTAVEARIGQLRDDKDPRRRIVIEVFVVP